MAFTDKATSFDGTNISVNFSPSVLSPWQMASCRTPTPSWWGPGLVTAEYYRPGHRRHRSRSGRFRTDNGSASRRERIQRADLGSARRVRVGAGAPVGQPAVRCRYVSSIISGRRRPRPSSTASATLRAHRPAWRFRRWVTRSLPRSAWLACRTAAASNVSAAIDPRIRIIIPGLVVEYAEQLAVPERGLQDRLRLAVAPEPGTTSGCAINPAIYQAVLLGDLLGVLRKASRRRSAAVGPGAGEHHQRPALFLQGTDDVVVPAAAGRYQRLLHPRLQYRSRQRQDGGTAHRRWRMPGTRQPGPQATVNVKATMAYLYNYIDGVPAAATTIWCRPSPGSTRRIRRFFADEAAVGHCINTHIPVTATGTGGLSVHRAGARWLEPLSNRGHFRRRLGQGLLY